MAVSKTLVKKGYYEDAKNRRGLIVREVHPSDRLDRNVRGKIFSLDDETLDRSRIQIDGRTDSLLDYACDFKTFETYWKLQQSFEHDDQKETHGV